jgi:hypothetical protein
MTSDEDTASGETGWNACASEGDRSAAIHLLHVQVGEGNSPTTEINQVALVCEPAVVGEIEIVDTIDAKGLPIRAPQPSISGDSIARRREVEDILNSGSADAATPHIIAAEQLIVS